MSDTDIALNIIDGETAASDRPSASTSSIVTAGPLFVTTAVVPDAVGVLLDSLFVEPPPPQADNTKTRTAAIANEYINFSSLSDACHWPDCSACVGEF